MLIPRRRHGYNPTFPLGIASLKGWWDASRVAVALDGTALATLSDLSGNGKDMAQASGTLQPIVRAGYQKGKGALEFDGSNDTMATASVPTTSQVYTMALAFRTVSAGGVYFRCGTSNSGYDFRSSSGRAVNHNNVATYSDGAITTNFETWVVTWDGASFVWLLNGNVVVPSGSPSAPVAPATSASISPSAAHMFFGEGSIYAAALTGGDLWGLVSYLVRKWRPN